MSPDSVDALGGNFHRYAYLVRKLLGVQGNQKMIGRDDVESLAERARSCADVALILETLIEKIDSKQFSWSNCNLRSFLFGMQLAVQAFDPEPQGELSEVVDQGPWRVLAEVINMALELD